MKKFQFKFTAVEKVRKSKEDDALRVLADAQRELQKARTRKEQLFAQLNQSLIRRENLGKESVSVTAFLTEEDFIVGTKQRIIQAEQGILRASRSVEKALRAYLFARRQTRMIEVLREKAVSEYRKERSKWEQRQTDELYVMRAGVSSVTSLTSGEAA